MCWSNLLIKHYFVTDVVYVVCLVHVTREDHTLVMLIILKIYINRKTAIIKIWSSNFNRCENKESFVKRKANLVLQIALFKHY